MSKYVSAATITIIGLTCKSVLKLGLCPITVNGLPKLLAALDSSERENGRGVVTVCNHISTLDEPLSWGVLPCRNYWTSRKMRWTLGAADILFTNPVLSAFFRNGQVLKTVRGAGIYQPAVDTAIEKLSRGDWIHLFGEGNVCQPDTYPVENGIGHLRRFKWGIGRIVMETPRPPMIIPMWITGFDKLMPEGRGFPFNFIPHFGAKLSVTFGDPHGKMKRDLGSDEESRDVRIAVTEVVQRAVEDLGRSVSGTTLGVKPVTQS
ncbi:acyltransferase-domain-containing protein [Vararia minispora EC-137]|uniref:Acyltransferase-domain-containing protein n=1 Tax=Vararia minispora EC-137 TaxID=1314806 RepID=A0ACB8Q821_9AGAM|nr:acyltransferase-domain-containing protein [Vararia minispora EC-137]